MQLLSFYRRHLHWKIILPFAALSLLVALAGTYLTTRVVAGSLGERFDNQLVEASRVASDAFVLRERRHLEAVRAVTFSDGVSTAVAAHDSAQLERLVMPIAVNAGLDRAEIVDADGRLLYGTFHGAGSWQSITQAQGEAYGDWTPVRKVLGGFKDASGDKYAGLVRTSTGAALYSAGPVLLDGRLVGAVLVGSELDSLLANVKREALGDLVIYDNAGAPVGTTLPKDGPNNLTDLALEAFARSSIAPGTALRQKKTFDGRDFDLLYAPLSLRGEVVGAYSVALPSSFIATAASVTRWHMTALFAIATLAVLLVGWLVARTVTKPVISLARTARAVSDGDLSARSGVTTADEIGVLATAFDTMTDRLQRQHVATIKALASAIDARDPYTLGHSMRVGQLAALIGHTMGLSTLERQQLEIGGYLHDIGKIGVRDSVLLKAGALTEDERRRIEEHPMIGLRIIESIDLPGAVREFVAAHHERIDGSGYPRRLREGEVSLFARIAAVADTYDALITDRPYRPALNSREVLEILQREEKENRLDGRVVAALLRVAPEWEERRLYDITLKGFAMLSQPVAMAS